MTKKFSTRLKVVSSRSRKGSPETIQALKTVLKEGTTSVNHLLQHVRCLYALKATELGKSRWNEY